MSEQRRIGDREERGEGCAEKKKNALKEKGKCIKREIYCRVRMEHITKSVKGLEREISEQCGMECKMFTVVHASSSIVMTFISVAVGADPHYLSNINRMWTTSGNI